MDIAVWLRGLGLERYEQAFRENDIDPELLPELTADDLISLGISSIGPSPQNARRNRRTEVLRTEPFR